MEERVQKILAQAGFGSRRACEDLIQAGRVTVNGEVIRLGRKADPDRDRIAVDGERVTVPASHVYIAVYKPRGVLSDLGDPATATETPTVRDLVPLPGHLFPVGRLDLPSEGLILLTDDGALAHRLTHPRYAHEKEYHVLVEGHPSTETLGRWRAGVFLDGRRTAPADVSILSVERDRTWLRVVLREGRKRQIRRVAAILGHPVRRLIRVRIAALELGTLKPGQYRRLTDAEVAALQSPPARRSRQTRSQTRSKGARSRSRSRSRKQNRKRSDRQR